MIKAVITAAGLGTRLLPITKEIPKEMLPIFVPSPHGPLLKPVVQVIFETLYNVGIREFCFIVGRGKRVIEDYFTPDYDFIEMLRSRGLVAQAEEMLKFYKMIETSVIVFINQPKPRGFGDAVLRAKPFVGNSPFIIHAGDDVVFPLDGHHIKKLIEIFMHYNADGVLLVEDNPEPWHYGVIVGEYIEHNILEVRDIVEKPKKPPSNLTVIAIYMLRPKIFRYLEELEANVTEGEIELTSAIKLMLQEGRVYAYKLAESCKRIDVGRVNSYWQALQTTFLLSVGGSKNCDEDLKIV